MQTPATTDQILDFLQKFRNEFCEFRDETNRKFVLIDKKFEQIDQKFAQIDQRLDQMDARFDRIDARLDQMDARLDRMDARFDQAETNMRNMEQRYLEDRKMMLTLIHEIKTQQREDHKMILDIWASRDKVKVEFSRKLYVATASISIIVSTIVSTSLFFTFSALTGV